jgi:hypothetical protein
VSSWKQNFQVQRKSWLLGIGLSFILQLLLAAIFPLTVDELHVWNILEEHQSFTSLLFYIRHHETHFPIFYLISFLFFNVDFSPLALRLPSVLLSLSSLYFWQKIFDYRDPKYTLAWLLILFCPFVLLYKSLYLTYSLLIFTSILAYSTTSFSIARGLPQAFSHYYGLFAFALRFLTERPKISKKILLLLVLILAFIVVWFGILDKLFHYHAYRQYSSPVKIVGFFNLLLGGALSSIVIIYFNMRKILQQGYKEYIQSQDFKFLTLFVLIVTFFTSLINPVAEARYFLVLLVPLYRLISFPLTKRLVLMILIFQVIGAYLLFTRFGPSFMINYKKAPTLKPGIQTGILITPCPRYFYRQEHTRCLNYFMNNDQLWSGNDRIILHQDHLPFFESHGNDSILCEPFFSGLLECHQEIR